MTDQPSFSDVPAMEDALRARGVSMDTFLDRAGINKATWWRWRTKAFHPRMQTWDRACAAYRELTADPVEAK